MFGLFSKQKCKYTCPMCKREYSIRLDPSKQVGVIFKTCEFCKLEFTLYLMNGSIKTIDRKWESVEQEHDEKIRAADEQIKTLESEVKELEDQVTQNGINTPAIEKKFNQLEKKIDQLDLKKQKLINAFDQKETTYSERQSKWEQKWLEKQERG